MSLNENIKKNNEHVWAAVFVHEINRFHKTDYYIEPEWSEFSPVDMHVVSKSGKHPHLDLQLTYAIELPFVAVDDESKTLDATRKPTIEAIEKKYQKYSEQGTDMTHLILVIQGYMKKSVANKVFNDPEFTKYKKFPFKGIYYVSPPMISEETNEHLQSGYVKAIKEAF